MDRIHLSYPAPKTIFLQGHLEDLEMIEELIRNLRQYEESLETDSDDKLKRLELRYLYIGNRYVRRNKNLIQIPGVKSSLLEMMETLDQYDPLLLVRGMKILVDEERNVLILQGSPYQLLFLKKLIEIWDRPVPQIKN